MRCTFSLELSLGDNSGGLHEVGNLEELHGLRSQSGGLPEGGDRSKLDPGVGSQFRGLPDVGKQSER